MVFHLIDTSKNSQFFVEKANYPDATPLNISKELIPSQYHKNRIYSIFLDIEGHSNIYQKVSSYIAGKQKYQAKHTSYITHFVTQYAETTQSSKPVSIRLFQFITLSRNCSHFLPFFAKGRHICYHKSPLSKVLRHKN